MSLRSTTFKVGTLSLLLIVAIQSSTRRLEKQTKNIQQGPCDDVRHTSGRRLTTATEEEALRLANYLPNFHFSEHVQVLGPTVFPKPSDVAEQASDDVIVPALQPVIGQHRPDQDAVFAFAAEYPIKNYVLFVQSLRKTGFTGDIVLSVHEIDLRNAEIRAFLSSDPGVVVYAPSTVCYNAELETVESVKGGMRTCQTHKLWGKRHTDGTVTPLPDPRSQRTVANTRYEIYWIMALQYAPQSWILIVDARDTVFQSNPFADVPRQTDPTAKSGVLYFFGENMDATRLGRSKQNSKWLQNAYGDVIGEHLKDKPTICSGASMGEQIALEAYIRAMVAEGDETGTVLMGSDQGFHNRLFYSHKLANARHIHDIVVFDQGTGIVNNMGALRTKSLTEWGNGKILKEGAKGEYSVLNWDGTKSAVVHQFDRHKMLTKYFFKEQGELLYSEWQTQQKIRK
jgi:hypothetical protein